jgi:2-keto-4-pentenoate hydratase/2-oxohepta-3-ene-1,7-dioic acid hydratase in catechol pathway
MKLVLFGSRSDSPRGARVGVLLDDATVADVTQAAANAGHVALSSMRTFLDAGDEGGKWAAAAVADPTLHLRLDAERALLAPIYDPEKVLCVGMNYVDHCTEQGVPIPVEPIIFNKFASAIRASGDPLIKSSETAELDFEVELTVVIGKTGKRISKEDALSYVAGALVVHVEQM